MNSFLAKNKYYILMSGFLVVIGVLIAWVVPYFFGKINETSNRIQELNAENENNLRILTELPAVRKEFSEMESRLSELREFFVRDNMVLLAQDLEKIAAETNNQIEISIIEAVPSKLTRGKSEEEKILNYESKDTLNINIKLKGSYGDLVKYLQKVRGIKYYNDIVSLKIEAFDEAGEVGLGSLYEKRFIPIGEENEVDTTEEVFREPELREGVISNLEMMLYLK